MTHTILYFQSYKSNAKWMNHYKSTASQYMHWSRTAATEVAAVALLLPINIQPYHYQYTNTYQSTLHKHTTTILEHNTSTHTELYQRTVTSHSWSQINIYQTKSAESETCTNGAKALHISSLGTQLRAPYCFFQNLNTNTHQFWRFIPKIHEDTMQTTMWGKLKIAAKCQVLRPSAQLN